MSIGYFATLAGDRLDQAVRNADVANEWRDRALELEQELALETDFWKNHVAQLNLEIKAWQQNAIQGEAISRAKTDVVCEATDGKAPIDFVGEEAFDQVIEAKKEEVMKEWGVNPWGK